MEILLDFFLDELQSSAVRCSLTDNQTQPVGRAQQVSNLGGRSRAEASPDSNAILVELLNRDGKERANAHFDHEKPGAA